MSAFPEDLSPPPARPVPHPSAELGRLRQLVRLQTAASGDGPVEDVLQDILDAACELTGSRHGRIELARAHHRLDRTAGVPGDEPSQSLVTGITSHGETFGELTLFDPAAGSFSAEDEELVVALAASAATAIARDRLMGAFRRHQEWTNGSAQITRALLAGADIDYLLEIVSRALQAAEADMGMLALPGEDGVLRAAVAVGLGAERFGEWTFRPDHSPISAIMCGGRPALRASLDGLTRPGFDNVDDYGPIMVAPLVDNAGVRGSMLLVRTADRAPFTPCDLNQLVSFADQVTLAIDMDEARNDTEYLRVLEVRHGIAQELHDNVIQRLFATGMGLNSISSAELPPAVAERLARYVGELDETIDDIREQVFGLRATSQAKTRPQSRFRRLPTTSERSLPPLPRA